MWDTSDWLFVIVYYEGLYSMTGYKSNSVRIFIGDDPSTSQTPPPPL